MIRINNKSTSIAPEILINKGAEEVDKLKNEYNNGTTNFTFDSNIYGHKEVKEKLAGIQNNKCCFCEAKIRHVSYGDVEHFRPKAGWVQNDEEINKPGYYWLAYNWDNLFLSCQICNQRFKKNYFPLINEAERVLNYNGNIENEMPVFIHPVNDDPELFIEFNENVPEAIDDNIRGLLTIRMLGLNRVLLNEHRKKTLNMVKDIYDLAKDFPDNPPDLKTAAKNKILKYHEKSKQDETEYASMLRCFFRKNPVNF